MNAVVIGAGFAGIAAATALRELRFEVTLLERRGVLGGRATSYRDAASGDDVDSGALWLRSTDAATLELVHRAGASHLLLPPDRAGRVFLRRGFAALHQALHGFLQDIDVYVRTRALAERIDVEDGRVRGVTLAQRAVGREQIRRGVKTANESVAADVVVCAVPWHALPELLPQEWRTRPPFARLADIGSVAGLTVHLWVDRVVGSAATLDVAGADLVVDAGRLHGRTGPPQHLVMALDARVGRRGGKAGLTAVAADAIGRAHPGSSELKVTRSIVLREPHGWPEGGPRPGATTPIEGLVLAGDWTGERLPATIERAVYSGIAAAAVIERASRPRA